MTTSPKPNSWHEDNEIIHSKILALGKATDDYKRILANKRIVGKRFNKRIDDLLEQCDTLLKSNNSALDNNDYFSTPARETISDMILILCDITGRTTSARWYKNSVANRLHYLETKLADNARYKAIADETLAAE